MGSSASTGVFAPFRRSAERAGLIDGKVLVRPSGIKKFQGVGA
jgi:hypothetical protein